VARFEAVDRLVRTAFQQRRKTLANALRPLLAPGSQGAGTASPTGDRPAVDLIAVLGGLGIDPTRRPETLTPEEFVHLADALIPLSVL
jgi:16S rRNA A1518/A1519 N6-dimethyltransferase RsmA/KsgA/DIM1 with predicted DNA glycosylase/AP lyase activity